MLNHGNEKLRDSGTRFETLRKLLDSGFAGTQDELSEKLSAEGFEVTQSTISRDLRKLGAVKVIDESGRTVYRFQSASELPPLPTSSLADLVSNITSNGSIIVLHTHPGSASLVARHLDHFRPGGILGTLAGDDTIFVAPADARQIRPAIEAIRSSLGASA